ncbi:type III secretion system export apparatus subunit SctU [Paraburkholderia sp. ZP32-5]|uniref:type III secretion system export apparatus subunit SctU n=1 Tax=Paraburkholderia sp. ZP32-5 TaxID=2883245 RepID=UPI001F246C86|nr:type III secretion system export apparatus subunit SctU [Paraburkholderia sp. ZP32-5]
MSDDKTEEPSDKKLKKAREEGQVSKSTDIVDGVVLLSGVVVMIAFGNTMVDTMRSALNITLRFVAGQHDMRSLQVAFDQIAVQCVSAIAPALAAGVLAVVISLMPQVGFVFSTKAVSFNFGAVSPVSGIKKLFSLKTIVDLLKTVLKGVLVSLVMWQTIEGLLPLIIGSLSQPVPQLSRLFSQLLIKLLEIAAGLFIVLGAADFKLQKFLFLRGQKMSKEEVKREYKESEGDPMLKGQRKQLAREIANSPPRQKVAGANMLVVNPVHYAVAVRYAPEENPLPFVIAKGSDKLAATLRREAELENVPIIGNPPMARALYKVNLNEEIPEELFEAVAAILRWVDSIGLSPSERAARPPA